MENMKTQWGENWRRDRKHILAMFESWREGQGIGEKQYLQSSWLRSFQSNKTAIQHNNSSSKSTL